MAAAHSWARVEDVISRIMPIIGATAWPRSRVAKSRACVARGLAVSHNETS
jgi:hypothetical protein